MIKEKKIDMNELMDRYKDNEFLNDNKVDFHEHFKKNNVAILVLLEHNETKQKILVGNVHILWDPNYDHTKYAQTFWLLKCIDDFLKENDLTVDEI